jgi:hypothetical protein
LRTASCIQAVFAHIFGLRFNAERQSGAPGALLIGDELFYQTLGPLLGPGSVGEADAPWAVAEGGYAKMQVLPAGELAASTGDADAFSYHHYGAVSQRCAAMGHQTSADQALTEDWLGART